MIQKKRKKHGIVISKGQISNTAEVNNIVGIKQECSAVNRKNNSKQVSQEEAKRKNILEVKALILKENPVTQRTVAKSIKSSLSTVSKIYYH